LRSFDNLFVEAITDPRSFIAKLQDQDENTRRNAADVLKQMSTIDKGLLPPMMDYLSKPLPFSNQDVVILAIGKIGPEAEAAVPLLVERLIHFNEPVRQAAEVSLKKIDPEWVTNQEVKKSVPQLIKKIGEAHPNVDGFIEKLVLRIGLTKEHVPLLTGLLKHRSPHVPYIAIKLLRPFGPDAEEAIPEMVRFLKDPVESNRIFTAETMAALNPDWMKNPQTEAATQDLLQRLRSQVPHEKEAAALTIAYIGPPAKHILPDMLRGLLDKNPKVREHLLAGFKRMGPEAMPLLLQQLDEADPAMQPVIRKAVLAVGAIPKAVNAESIGVLSSKYAILREEAATSFGSLGPAAKDAIPALLRTLGDRDFRVREAARTALNAIDPNWSQHPGISQVVAEFSKGLQNPDAQVRVSILHGLRSLETAAKEAIPDVAKLLVDADPATRDGARETLKRLAAEWWTHPRIKDATPELRKGLASKDWRVREAAAATLGTIGSSAKEVIPELIKSLADPELAVREAVVKTLGEYSAEAKEAIPELERTEREDPSPFVRNAASAALKRIRSDP
jgi:HEAT repeat protein